MKPGLARRLDPRIKTKLEVLHVRVIQGVYSGSAAATAPALFQLFLVGLQHVLLMYGGAIAVPLIIGQAAGLSREDVAFLINADLLVAGVATLVQSLGIGPVGIRMPVMMGASFAAVGSMVAMAGMPGVGLQGIFGATIAAGFFGMLVAPFMSKVVRFFPPLVTGTVITSIGLSLFPVAVNWAGGGQQATTFGSPIYLLVAGLVLAVILLINRFMRGFWVNVSVLVGMGLGYLLAGSIGMVDLSGLGATPGCRWSRRCTLACPPSAWPRSCRCAWWW